MWGPLLALWVAHAAPAPASPHALRVPVGANASIQIFRQVEPGLSHFLVQGCSTDLGQGLDGRSAPGIEEIDAVGVGGRVWFVMVKLEDPREDLALDITDGRLGLAAVPPGEQPPAPEAPIFAPAELLTGTMERTPPEIPAGLHFLWGDALLPAIDPGAYQPDLPIFAPGTGPATWAELDRQRALFLETDSRRVQAEAAYALGWIYFKFGFVREARYYFDLLPSFDDVLDPRVTALTRTRVALVSRDWEAVRGHLSEALEAGATPEQVLETLALVSLATSQPPPAATARALLLVSNRPECWLLAAELLQRDGLFAASLQVLTGLEARLPPSLAPAAALRRGDALLVSGRLEEALRAYEQAPPEPAALRRLHVTLLQRTTTAWPQAIPDLRRIARGDGYTAAEAAYLLAEIHAFFGESTQAMADLGEIGRRFPDIFARSDGIDRQLALHGDTVRCLAEEKHWVDVAALHREVWTRALLAASDDHRPLLSVADAFEAIGLPEEARRTLTDAFFILSRKNGDDPELVFRLARLYADAGRSPEALETLDYLERHSLPASYRGQRAMLSGRIYQSLGQEDAAARAFVSAAQQPGTRDAAQIALALIDAEAGRCGQAIPSLQRLLMPERKRSLNTDSLPYLALARCLMVEGRTSEAAEVAREAAGRIDTPENAREANYLAMDPASLDPASDLGRVALMAEPDVWARLGAEDMEDHRFQQEVAARRGGSTGR
jgi:tetratricopeptide (TPR) repeat protein